MATAPTTPLAGMHSARWLLLNAVHTALQTAPELTAYAPTLYRNPVAGTVKLDRGQLAVVLQWDQDRKARAVGMDEQRSFRLLVGSLANTAQADADADVLHEAVISVLRRLMSELNAIDGVREVTADETDIDPTLEGVPIEGALIVSTLTLQYRQRARHFRASA